MRNFSEEEINDFLNYYDYDIRKSNDARWIDQKCTMDVISLIADCIINFISDDVNKEFCVGDIWHAEYTVENVQQIFSKPNPEKKAKREYDKYFGQPMKLLGYSKVLKCEVRKQRNYYKVNNLELLKYISLRERNALKFLSCYIEKVLKDSGLFNIFEMFLNNPNKNTFYDVKNAFYEFTIMHTPINKKLECGRIFSKVLNPLSCKYRTLGTVKGRLSEDNITFDMMAYNQRNWRDLYSKKPKDMTRLEYEKLLPKEDEDKMTIYRINKAKKFLRAYNDIYRNGRTELEEKSHMQDLASQMHHIFPVSFYPEIADYYENLIALTPTQHLTYAHPNNNTSYVDRMYQYFCLIAKCSNIKENITNHSLNTIYSFDDFIYVLNIGLETDEFDKISNLDFGEVLRVLEKIYDAA